MRQRIEIVVLAGVGGMIPTLSRLAGTYVTDPSTPLPQYGVYFALLLFFVLGSVLAYAFSERNRRQAFVLGVCAPGIITNIVAGANQSAPGESAQVVARAAFSTPVAYAAESSPTPTVEHVDHSGAANSATTRPSGRSVEVNAEIEGGGTWDKKRLPITITYQSRDGKTVNAGTILPGKSAPFAFQIPPGVSTIELKTGESVISQSLPEGDFDSAKLNYRAAISGRNDFWWALGATRQPIVSKAEASWSDVSRPPSGNTDTSLVGTQLLDANGAPLGTVSDMKIVKGGSVEVCAKAGDGTTRSFPLGNFDVTDEGVLRMKSAQPIDANGSLAPAGDP